MNRIITIVMLLTLLISCGGDPYLLGIKTDNAKKKQNREQILTNLNGYLNSDDQKFNKIKQSAEAWKIKGDLEVEINNDFKAAKMAYDKALELDADKKFTREIHVFYAETFNKKYSTSVDLYNKAIAETNSEKKTDLLKSIKMEIESATSLIDTIPNIYTILGKTEDQLGLDSKSSFMKAISLFKDNEKKATAYADYGFSLFDKKMYAESAMNLEKSYILRENQDVLKFMALSYKYSENNEKASQYMRKYIDNFSDPGSILSYYTESLYNQRKIDELISFLENYLPNNPNVQVHNYQFLGNAYISKYNDLKKDKKLDEANQLLKQCIKFMTIATEVDELKTNSDIWYFIAVSHQYLGNKKDYQMANKNYNKYKN
jgi:tetratricopeptide (TPR) repeat protein